MATPYQAVPNTALATVEFITAGVTSTINLNFGFTAPVSYGDLTALSTALKNWYTNDLMALVSNEVALTGHTLYALDASDAPKYEEVFAANAYVGAVVSPPVPFNAQAVVKFQCGGRGRSSRGRVYIPGWAELAVDARNIDPTYGALAVTVFQALNAKVAAAGCQHVVVSRYFEGLKRTEGLAQVVQTYTYNPVIGTQRRAVR